MENVIYEKLIKLANKSLKSSDVPVGAIIVKNGKDLITIYNNPAKIEKLNLDFKRV